MGQVAIRVDDQLKEEATILFQKLGFDMSTACRMFLKKCVVTQSIPFELSVQEELFNKLVVEKSEQRKVDFSNSKDVKEFFGDEDFSDYNEVFN